VTVYDGKYNNTATFTIIIQDVNDMPPVFSAGVYTFTNSSEATDYTSSPFSLGTVMFSFSLG